MGNDLHAQTMTLPGTDLQVSELCFGANVFGWSIREQATANDLLNHLLERGVNFFDSADVYVEWAEGNSGGESETMLGQWLSDSGVKRDEVVIATKVGKLSTRSGLRASNIIQAAEESLQRLGTDYIDLYYAHYDDQDTPLEETLTAFHSLVTLGKVRYLGASNYTVARLDEARTLAAASDVAPYVAVQNHYNLVHRDDYEAGMAAYVADNNLAGLPYFSLASGFLTGKYTRESQPTSVRSEGVGSNYSTDAHFGTLDRLLEVASQHSVEPASVALEWLRQQPGVSVPIASASRINQVASLLERVNLSTEELGYLARA